MANFEDITGWQEELDAYMESEEYQTLDESRDMPIEWVPELMQLVLRHPEMHDIFMTYGTWVLENHKFDRRGNPIGLLGLPDDFPHKESEKAAGFATWFFNIGKNVRKILPMRGVSPAIIVARLIAENKANITQQELISELRRIKHINFFDLSRSGNSSKQRKKV